MTVYLIRHGQSEFNALNLAPGAADPMIVDAQLTELGRQQALAAREQILDLGIQSVLTTPLTRAIQTAKLIFDGIAPIQVVADHRERLDHACDIGRAPKDLEADFPELSFDHLNDVWWHSGPQNQYGVPTEPHGTFNKRIQDFCETLDRYSSRPLAIVGHGNTFRALADFDMMNCEVRELSRS